MTMMDRNPLPVSINKMTKYLTVFILLLSNSMHCFSESIVFVGYVNNARVDGKRIVANVQNIKAINGAVESNLAIEFGLSATVSVGGYYIFEVREKKGLFRPVRNLNEGILLHSISYDRGGKSLIFKDRSIKNNGHFQIGKRIYFPDDCSRGAVKLCIHFQSYIKQHF